MMKTWQRCYLILFFLLCTVTVCSASSRLHHHTLERPLYGFGIFIALLCISGVILRRLFQYLAPKKPRAVSHNFPNIVPGIHLWMCPIALRNARLHPQQLDIFHGDTLDYLNKDVVVKYVGRDRKHFKLYIDTARAHFCILTTTADNTRLSNDAYFFSFQYNTDTTDFEKIASSQTYKTTDGVVWTRSESLKAEIDVETLDSLSGLAPVEVPYRSVVFERSTGLKDEDFQTEYLLIRELNQSGQIDSCCQIFTGIHLSVDHCLPADLIGEYCEH